MFFCHIFHLYEIFLYFHYIKKINIFFILIAFYFSMWYYFTVIKNIGVSPSGKASDSDSDIPVFESQYPSQYVQKVHILTFFQLLRRNKMKHIKTINEGNLKKTAETGGCGKCQASCQSACKTSCTVANQKCEH